MSQARPVLYSFRRCPYAMRARLALAAAGLVCELREVVLRDKPAALLRASPKGTVPVLVMPEGEVIDESLDIMLWALRRSDPQAMLAPPEGSLDDMLALIGQNDHFFKARLDRYKYPVHFGLHNGLADRDVAGLWLKQINDRFDGRDWLQGRRPALADLAIAPFVRQYAHVDRDWFDDQPWPALQAWLARCLDSDGFAAIMHRYSPWAPGKAPVLFPPAGA